MKCFLVLAAVLALSSATMLFRGRDITLDPSGRLLITGFEGKRILLNNLDGRRFFEIVEPNMPNKMIEIVDDDLFNNYDKTDLVFGTKTFHRYLIHLLRQLQDVLDEQSYHNLLMSVENAYNNGHYSNTMYDLARRMMVNDMIRDNQIVQDGVYDKYHHGLMGLFGKQNVLGYNRYAPMYQGHQNVYDYYGNMDTTRYGMDTTRYGMDTGRYGMDTTRYGMDTTRYVNPLFQHYYNKIAHQPMYNQYYQQYENVIPYNYEYYNQIPSMYKDNTMRTMMMDKMMRNNMVTDKNMRDMVMDKNMRDMVMDKTMRNMVMDKTMRDIVMDKTMHRDMITDKTYPIHHMYGTGYGYGFQHQMPFVYQNERVHQYEPVVPQIVY